MHHSGVCGDIDFASGSDRRSKVISATTTPAASPSGIKTTRITTTSISSEAAALVASVSVASFLIAGSLWLPVGS